MQAALEGGLITLAAVAALLLLTGCKQGGDSRDGERLPPSAPAIDYDFASQTPGAAGGSGVGDLFLV